MKSLPLLLLCTLSATSEGAIWEIDLGGKIGDGILGGNVVQTRPSSFASGKEVGFNEIPGILYDDVSNILEFHVGWGSDPIVGGTQLNGQYLSSGLYAPASMYENAPFALYTFDTSNGYRSVGGEPTGRSGFINTQVQLVDLPGYTVAQQEADLLGSKFYFSISTTAFESGEIRGQLLTAVPEPEHYAMFAGMALLGFAGYRKFKKSEKPA